MSNIYGILSSMRNGSRKNLILNRQVQTVASIQSKLLFQTKLRALYILSSLQLWEVDGISISI